MKGIPRPRLPKATADLAKERIKFRFHYVKRKGKYSCKSLSAPQAEELKIKLKQYKQMSVLQFRQSGGVRLKNIKLKLKSPDHFVRRHKR